MRLRLRTCLQPGFVLVTLVLAGPPLIWPLGVLAASPVPSPRVHHPLHNAPPSRRAAVPNTASGPSGYIPCDLSGAYHLNSLQGAGITGTGQLIAIVDAFDNPTVTSDLHAFDAGFGLSDPSFSIHNLGAGAPPGPGWDTEIDLDVEWAHAAAPGAAIGLVEVVDNQTSSLLAGVDYSVNVLGADVVSMSWGTPSEFAGEMPLDTHFPAASPTTGKPVMYVAAAGDAGFGTSWPAVSPQVLGVGGTSLASSAVGNDTQFTHYNCRGMTAPPGVTSQNESVWGIPQCTGTSCQGTGGGTSTMEPKPSWQTGYGPSGGRTMPDVAMLADPATGVAIYSGGAWSGSLWGGTSLATPLWAGVIALVNQQRHANGAANLNVTTGTSWAYQVSGLNDIVRGRSPSRSSDSCLTTGACLATPGYDQVTGRGTPLASSLVDQLSPWEPLGGPLTSAPDAASWGPGRLDVFARGANNDLQYRSWSGGQWSGWQSLGGVLTSAPGVVSWGPGRLDVFVRGIDSALWHRGGNGNAWSGWEQLGGGLTSSPDVASWSSGRIDIFVRGSDNGLWHKWWSGAWSGWESHGGVLTSDPAAVSWGPNRVDTFVRGTDNALWHRWWDGRWNGWERLGGTLGSSVGAASSTSGELDLLALTPNNDLQYRSWSGGQWSGWLTIGGNWASAPGAVSQHNGTVDAFEKGTDGQLWHTRLPAAQF